MIGTKAMIIAPSPSEKKQSALIIVVIALCIHGGLGSLLFVLEPAYSLPNTDDTQIILFDEQALNKQNIDSQKKLKNLDNKPKDTTSLVSTPPEEWAEMLGRKNNFGLPEGEVAFNTAAPLLTREPKTSTQSDDNQSNNNKDETATPLAKQTAEKKEEEQPSVKPDIFSAALTKAESQTTFHKTAVDAAVLQSATSLAARQEPSASQLKKHDQNESFPQFKTSHTTNLQQTPSLDTPAKHSPSGLTLAAIGKGFIEQTRFNGEHNVTMLGKKGGIVTAEQLKIERYVERLSWCLQNSFKFLNNTINPHLLTETKVHVYLQLDRSGSIQELKLIRSSGNTLLDQHTLTVFKNAGTSFPPVPTYIKASPFSLAFHVDYGITERSVPLSFSFQH